MGGEGRGQCTDDDDAGRETDQISVCLSFFFSLAIMVNLYESQKCHWIDHSHS